MPLQSALLAAGCLAALINPSSAAEGAPHLLNYFTSWPWTGVTGGTVVSGNHLLPENGGTTVAFSFLNPLAGVDVSNPASPNVSPASASYFGLISGSGLGVADTTAGYFNIGEQFSLQANHKFALKELQFDEYTADEVLHIAWTQNGTAQSVVLTLGLVSGGRIESKNIIYPIPSGTTIIADANTPIRITNVSGSLSNSAGRLRLVRMVTAPVFASPPTYTTAGTDGYEQMFGVNLAGADGGTIPGTLNFDYHYPKPDAMDYFNAKGLKLVRVPFRWKRIQQDLMGPLRDADMNELDRVVTDAEARGMKVILDMHDYGGRGSYKIGSPEVPLESFKDVWKKIATRYKGRPGIYGYGLSNEPYGMGEYSWPLAAQAGADGVREADQHSWIIVGGENWSSSSEWINANPNLDVQDPYGRLMYEAHTYFDKDRNGVGYGTYAAEYAHESRGVYFLEPFVRWLKQRNARGFIGEYAAPNDGDSRWLTVLQNYLNYAGANGLSGTYWLAGQWSGGDPNTVQPTSNYTVDKPQMAVIAQSFAYGYVRPEIIVDNLALADTTGWTASTSTAAIGPYYGTNYLHDGNAGKGAKSLLFVPNVRSPDHYEVSARWTSHDNRASNTPMDVIAASGVSSSLVNQRVGGGQWFSLGTHTFAGGQGGGVQVSNDATNGYVIADAIRLQKSIPVTIIMDNSGAGITWTPDAAAWAGSTTTSGYVGANYVHDGGANKGSKAVRFTPTIPVTGDYEVFVRWTSGTNRAGSVPVEVNYDGGSVTQNVDQRTGGGVWKSMGIRRFVQGTGGSVKISNTGTSGVVIVDAVRFHKR